MDLPRVSLVIHWDAADSMLDFVQQTGRGGRDGSPFLCITFYDRNEIYGRINRARKNSDRDRRDHEFSGLTQVRFRHKFISDCGVSIRSQ
jgi:superfamily II DNA helicase RecQ